MAVSWSKSGAQTSVLETVALLVIIGLGFWFFVRPQMSVLNTEQDSLQQAQAELKQVDQDKTQLNELITKLKKSQNDLAIVDEALPLQNRPSQMEYLINEKVTAAGMQLNDLGLTVTENAGSSVGNKKLAQNPYMVNRRLQTTKMNLTVTGGVDQLKNLLQLLESNGRVIDVSTLSMSNEGDAPSFSMQLKMYSYVP